MTRFDIPDKLAELAEVFKPHATLYAVGGYVRDSILGISRYDIDVCSKLLPSDVKGILSGTEFVVSDKNLRVGTVQITAKNFCVEYTAFRSDSYPVGGAHSPSEVNFTDDITLDAARRDFKCNAVYLDIARGELVDPLGGIPDIESRTLTRAADDVFYSDGLRVLRLVRFMAELGFEIEAETLRSAKENAHLVCDIAPERIRDELCRIFVADSRHSELALSNAHLKGLMALDDLGLIDILLPEVAALKGLKQPPQYHLYDAYGHSVKAFELSPPRLRWAALLHDVGKAIAVRQNGNMHGHETLGSDAVSEILARLRFNKRDITRCAELVRYHMTDINGNTSREKLRRFVVRHAEIMDDLCDLIDIDGLASAGRLTRPNRLREAYKETIDMGLPLSVKELKVGGKDLIALDVPERERAKLLDSLLEDTAMNPSLNDRGKALAYLENATARNKDN